MNEATTVFGFELAIIIAVLIAALTYYSNRRRRIRALYEVIWKSSRNLKPKEILGIRAEFRHGYHKYYFEVEENRKLEKCIEDGKNVILIGNPLAGKSRTVFHTIKNFDKCLNVLIPKITDVNSVDFIVPHSKTFWRKKIVVLDDLNKYASKQNFSYLLDEFRRIDPEKLILIATCRTEPEFNVLNDEILEMFDAKIIFDRFPEKDAALVARRAHKPKPINFDGNIGSIFVDLTAMKDRFKSVGIVEKTLLQAIKRMYWAGIYEGKEIFTSKKIKTVLEKLSEKKFRKIEFETVLNSISDQGFVTLLNGNLKIEETYLDKVIEDKFSLPENLIELLDTFSDDPDSLHKIGNRATDFGERSKAKAAFYNIAIKAYSDALKFWTFKKTEKNYAKSQNNLGNAYVRLGEFTDKKEKAENCKLAIIAFNEALKIYTREQYRLDFARTQSNLGNAYQVLSDVEDKAENCKLAISANKKALSVKDLKRPPVQYATVLNNLGAAYQRLSRSENKSENCKLAIKFHNEALRIRTLDRFPGLYAESSFNLGIAFMILITEGNREKQLENTQIAFNEALKGFKIEKRNNDIKKVNDILEVLEKSRKDDS